MPTLHLTCPHCGSGISTTVSVDRAPERKRSDGPVLRNSPGARRAVRHWAMTTLGAGDWTNARLRIAYEDWSTKNNAPMLTAHQLSANLVAAGLPRWRNTAERGFTVTEEWREATKLARERETARLQEINAAIRDKS